MMKHSQQTFKYQKILLQKSKATIKKTASLSTAKNTPVTKLFFKSDNLLTADIRYNYSGKLLT